nr:12990_t:CDS:2 [Entrophospora candida]
MTPVRSDENVEPESLDTKTTPSTSFVLPHDNIITTFEDVQKNSGSDTIRSTTAIATTNYLSQKTPAGISKHKKSFKPTIPKPFKFCTAARPNSKCHDETQKRSPFVPLAVKVKDFLKKDERSTFDSDKKINRGQKKPPTIPRSPKLHKSKASNTLSTEEQQMQKVKNNQFKAKSFNQKIFECSDLGLPKLQKIEPTVPESPVITKPNSQSVDDSDSVIFLDDINNNNLQENLDQNHDELGNTHLFKAQPAPSDTPDLPPQLHYSATHPKPFTLETDLRGERYQESFQEGLKDQMEHENENQMEHENENQIEHENENQMEHENENQMEHENENQIEHENENQLEHENENQMEHENENQMEHENENQLEHENENQLEHENENQLEHGKENQLEHGKENQFHSNKRPIKSASPFLGEKRRRYEQVLQDSSLVNLDLEVPLKYKLESTESITINSLNLITSNDQLTAMDSTKVNLTDLTIKFISEKINENNNNADELN